MEESISRHIGIREIQVEAGKWRMCFPFAVAFKTYTNLWEGKN
jgi:hypothetical protein